MKICFDFDHNHESGRRSGYCSSCLEVNEAWISRHSEARVHWEYQLSLDSGIRWIEQSGHHPPPPRVLEFRIFTSSLSFFSCLSSISSSFSLLLKWRWWGENVSLHPAPWRLCPSSFSFIGFSRDLPHMMIPHNKSPSLSAHTSSVIHLRMVWKPFHAVYKTAAGGGRGIVYYFPHPQMMTRRDVYQDRKTPIWTLVNQDDDQGR